MKVFHLSKPELLNSSMNFSQPSLIYVTQSKWKLILFLIQNSTKNSSYWTTSLTADGSLRPGHGRACGGGHGRGRGPPSGGRGGSRLGRRGGGGGCPPCAVHHLVGHLRHRQLQGNLRRRLRLLWRSEDRILRLFATQCRKLRNENSPVS